MRSCQKNAAHMPMCEKVLKQHTGVVNQIAVTFSEFSLSRSKTQWIQLEGNKTGYDLNWFEGSSRPEELSNAIKSCICKQDLPCSDESCRCKEMGWRCTLAYGCEGDCLNLPATHYEADSDSDDENN